MGCGAALVKIILFITNLAFALAGLALLGLGIALQLRIKVVMDLMEGYTLTPVFAMVLGSIVFVIAFFGCCGAIKESNCMLIMYAICMIVLMLAKLALAITIFVKLESLVEKDIPEWLDKAFRDEPQAFHQIETAFRCCGTRDPITSYPLPGTLPESCCDEAPCSFPSNVFMDGCHKSVSEVFDVFGIAIGVVLIAVVAIELVAVVFGLCLANHVRNKDRRAQY